MAPSKSSACATFVLRGRMPLLMHRDNIEASDLLDEWRKAPENKNISRAGDDRSPAWTWQTYLYHDGEHVAMPSENIMVALRQAGAQVIMKKQKTFKEITQSGLLIAQEFCEFRSRGQQIPIDKIESLHDQTFPQQREAVAGMGFKLFDKRAKIGQSKHVRIRPRFDDWEVTGTIQILKPEITWEVLQRLFEIAGSVGLCDWRPGCKTPGPYGMFEPQLKAA